MPDTLEFTLKIKLGEDGAANYFALKNALGSVTDRLERLCADAVRDRLPLPQFKQETLNVYRYDLFGPAVIIGECAIAPAKTKLSEHLLTAFPWLAEENETPVSGADTLDTLQQLYRTLTAQEL